MTVRAFKPTDHGPLEPEQVVVLDDEERHYLAKVRRVRAGDTVELHDLDGRWWLARVESLAAKELRVRVQLPAPAATPLPPTSLLLGLPDPKTVLELLPAVSELGVSEVVFVRCARSQTDGPGSARVARVLRAAMRQCGRPVAPEVVGPVTVPEALTRHPDWPGFVAVAGSRDALGPLRLDPRHAEAGVRVFVGPEGGLLPDEVVAAENAGFEPASLGPWVLRTQTAAQAMLAQVLGQRPGPG